MSNDSPIEPETANPFGVVQNKSLESQQYEVKDASGDDADDDADADAPESRAAGSSVIVRVKMLHHAAHGDQDLIPGHTYSLPLGVATGLVGAKRAVRV